MHHLAIDIGASSGRIVHGQLQNNKLVLQEIHRFPNRFSTINGQSLWDIPEIFNQILIGLQKAKHLGINTCTLGIDTWAVDYVLLDKSDTLLSPAFSYRDERTKSTLEKVFKKLDSHTLYSKTGIQIMPINTLFQLYEDANRYKATTVLLIPDYLNYLLTGIKTMEITNASTTQLLNIHTRDFDEELLQLLNMDRNQFPNLIEAGTVIGQLLQENFPTFDLPEATVIAVASHDTASAVLGSPSEHTSWAYLSSGTWSLVGVELQSPIVTEQSFKENYTNEYGALSTFRFLKNVMGLWIIQEVQRLLPRSYSFAELSDLARNYPCQQFINFNDQRFLNPTNMIEEIQQYCSDTNQYVPTSPGEIAAAVYHNLAILIAFHLNHIEEISKQSIDYLYIVGGGSNNKFLNECITTYSQRTVYAGPSEATAIGNLLLQLLVTKKINSLQEGRSIIHNSFIIECYKPTPFNHQELFDKFLKNNFI